MTSRITPSAFAFCISATALSQSSRVGFAGSSPRYSIESPIASRISVRYSTLPFVLGSTVYRAARLVTSPVTSLLKPRPVVPDRQGA